MLEETIEHANIIIKEGIDREDDIQGILKKLLNQIQKQQVEIEKKDKIIEEMAGYIATLDIEEDICSKTENEHCDKMNFGECEDCIKEYFKNKVEE